MYKYKFLKIIIMKNLKMIFKKAMIIFSKTNLLVLRFLIVIEMGELSELPNIGKVLENQLKEIGINTVDELIDLGSQETWLKIREIDESACLNRLMALEGAIQNIRWHDLSPEDKDNLRDFYNSMK